MAHKRNDPAANGVEGTAVFSENTASLTQKSAADNRPAITALRRGPGGKAEWLVTLDGVCTDAPMRDRRLRGYRRFRNVVRYRFGIEYSPMSQAAWTAMLDAAIAKAGAA